MVAAYCTPPHLSTHHHQIGGGVVPPLHLQRKEVLPESWFEDWLGGKEVEGELGHLEFGIDRNWNCDRILFGSYSDRY